MTREAGTLEQLAHFLGEALEPLGKALSPEHAAACFEQLGVRLPEGFLSQGPIAALLSSSSGAAAGLPARLSALSNAATSGNAAQIIAAGAGVLQQTGQLFQGLAQLATQIGGSAVTFPGLNAAQRKAISDLAVELPMKLTQKQLVEWIEGFGPTLAPALALSGLVDDLPVPGIEGDRVLVPYRRRAVRFDLLGTLFQKPGDFLSATIGLGKNDFDGNELFLRIQEYLARAGMPAVIFALPGQPNGLDAFLFRLAVNPGAPPGLKLRLRLSPQQDFSETTVLHAPWALRVQTRSRFDAGLEGEISPNGSASFRPPTGTASIDIGLGLVADGGADELVLLGEAGGTRLAAKRFEFRVGFAANWNGASADGSPAVGIMLDGGKLAIDTSKGDPFLRFLTGGIRGEANFTLSARWTPTDGLKFDGGAGLDIVLPTHASIGPARLDAVYLRAGFDSDGSIPVEISGAVAAHLGPIDVSVDRIGLIVRARFPKGGGNLGPLDLGLEFKPPTGVGLSVDVGGFRGGGFLSLDLPKGEYAGGLELDFLGIVTVKALALINTKLPGGGDGFSLVVIISAEFPPIQLGFGFTLLGVGGLLGLNRTLDENALREGVHHGALDSVLFPKDIVANAPRIIADMRRLFPPLDGHFLVGPMVKFGWGTPTILSLEFGFVLDIPRPAFTILGRLRIGLPFQELALFDVRVAFAGGVDLESGQLWFDGTLFDSRLLVFSLTGDMAVRLYWKENANFVLTVGGFHPAYTPPPLQLGSLQRLGITIFAGNPRLRAETYFAITSNTVQWGARAELYFGVDAFNIYGFIGYDVLIQFDPFRFIATLAAMLAVRTGSDVLMGIRIDALLEGPAPWHAKGTGHFEISIIISISIDVDFEVTFGEERHDTLPPVDLLPKLVEAFQDARNWRATLPAGSNLYVTLRELETQPDEIVLHPFGSLELTEKVAPLDLPIQKLGGRRIGDGQVFSVEKVSFGAEPAELTPLREQFAPAEYIEMTDAEKLSSRSFERYDAGVRCGGGDLVAADYFKSLEVEYEVIYVPEHRTPMLFRLATFLFSAFARCGQAAKSALSGERAAAPLGAPPVTYEAERFAVASKADLTLHSERSVFSSEAEARAALKSLVAADPALSRELQVVPSSFLKVA